MAAEYVYTVWFRDHNSEPEDQDYEWPACILIPAPSEVEALEWGDFLSRRHAEQHPERQFLRSDVELVSRATDTQLDGLPVVHAGTDVSDDHIGW